MGADYTARRLARLTAAGRTVLGDADASAQCATLGAWRVLAASAVAASVTVTTTETALATATLPGEAMGVHGILRVTSLWSHTNSADLRSLRARLDGSGVSGTQLMNFSGAMSATNMLQRTYQNRTAQNSQVSAPATAGTSFSAVMQGGSDSERRCADGAADRAERSAGQHG